MSIDPRPSAALRAVSSRRVPTALLTTLLVIALIVPACNPAAEYGVKDCARADLGGHSVARVWDEQLLSLIRKVVPAPTVHARNLFHTSAAMWDAWAAYDPTADGYFVTEKHTADDRNAAREAAMSYAAYRILSWRYSTVSDLKTAQAELDATMASLCYKTDFVSDRGRLAGSARQSDRRGGHRLRPDRRLQGGRALQGRRPTSRSTPRSRWRSRAR